MQTDLYEKFGKGHYFRRNAYIPIKDPFYFVKYIQPIPIE